MTPLESLERLKYFDEHILAKDNKFRICIELGNIEKALKEHKELKDKCFKLEQENLTLQMNIDIGIVLAKSYEKEHKALNIIKDKEIDFALFKECPNYDEYMEWCREKAKLTLQEYDLLREVLL